MKEIEAVHYERPPLKLQKTTEAYLQAIHHPDTWFATSLLALHPELQFRDYDLQGLLHTEQGEPLINLITARNVTGSHLAQAGITEKESSWRLPTGEYPRGASIHPRLAGDVVHVDHFLAEQMSKGLPVFGMAHYSEFYQEIASAFAASESTQDSERQTILFPHRFQVRLSSSDSFRETLQRLGCTITTETRHPKQDTFITAPVETFQAIQEFSAAYSQLGQPTSWDRLQEETEALFDLVHDKQRTAAFLSAEALPFQADKSPEEIASDLLEHIPPFCALTLPEIKRVVGYDSNLFQKSLALLEANGVLVKQRQGLCEVWSQNEEIHYQSLDEGIDQLRGFFQKEIPFSAVKPFIVTVEPETEAVDIGTVERTYPLSLPINNSMQEALAEGRTVGIVPVENPQGKQQYLAVVDTANQQKHALRPFHVIEVNGGKKKYSVLPMDTTHIFADRVKKQHNLSLAGLDPIVEGVIKKTAAGKTIFLPHYHDMQVGFKANSAAVEPLPGEPLPVFAVISSDKGHMWMTWYQSKDGVPEQIMNPKGIMEIPEGLSFDENFGSVEKQRVADVVNRRDNPWDRTARSVSLPVLSGRIRLGEGADIHLPQEVATAGGEVVVETEKGRIYRFLRVLDNDGEILTTRITHPGEKRRLDGLWSGPILQAWKDYQEGRSVLVESEQRLRKLGQSDLSALFTEASQQVYLYHTNKGEPVRVYTGTQFREGEPIVIVPYLSQKNDFGLASISLPIDNQPLRIFFSQLNEKTARFEKDPRVSETQTNSVLQSYLLAIDSQHLSLTPEQYRSLSVACEAVFSEQQRTRIRNQMKHFFASSKPRAIPEALHLTLESNIVPLFKSYKEYVGLYLADVFLPGTDLVLLPYIHGNDRGLATFAIAHGDQPYAVRLFHYQPDTRSFSGVTPLPNSVQEQLLEQFDQELAKHDRFLTIKEHNYLSQELVRAQQPTTRFYPAYKRVPSEQLRHEQNRARDLRRARKNHERKEQKLQQHTSRKELADRSYHKYAQTEEELRQLQEGRAKALQGLGEIIFAHTETMLLDLFREPALQPEQTETKKKERGRPRNSALPSQEHVKRTNTRHVKNESQEVRTEQPKEIEVFHEDTNKQENLVDKELALFEQTVRDLVQRGGILRVQEISYISSQLGRDARYTNVHMYPNEQAGIISNRVSELLETIPEGIRELLLYTPARSPNPIRRHSDLYLINLASDVSMEFYKDAEGISSNIPAHENFLSILRAAYREWYTVHAPQVSMKNRHTPETALSEIALPGRGPFPQKDNG